MLPTDLLAYHKRASCHSMMARYAESIPGYDTESMSRIVRMSKRKGSERVSLLTHGVGLV